VVTTPTDPSTCVVDEPSPSAEDTTVEPDEATELLAEGTPVCCVAPDGTATLLTPTPTPTPAATDPEALPESCEDATVVPVPEATASPAG
jgi:hypothetical protein